MRLVWYVGASAGLAASVVASAFYQRANFYSAMVHIAQSSASLLVLTNLVYVIYGSCMYGFQRLCFGPLRPTEIELLYEKGWFAITETLLAMTIFRDEIGLAFLVMFTTLITGKVWGWIGDGRIEVLEQQPPTNPRLFHIRLSISLLLSIVYDVVLFKYAADTVVQQARPSMMVMFMFEFAVLAVCSLHTAARYGISLAEQYVVSTQTKQRLEDRRQQVREQRAEILRRREAREAEGNAEGEGDEEEPPNENEIEEMDIEVPGWESKGQWVLTLDLAADFVKLCLYTVFFLALLFLVNPPIHIIRDWFMTTRSFLKRLHALVRYRQAVKHMDQYPDATAEDLGREDTCIICREEMRPWDPTDTSQVERTRAKRLPCGHILHFGCLKSWLERQQVCPTCRRPVTMDGQQPARNGDAVVFRLGINFPANQNQQAQPQAQPQPPVNGQAPAGQPGQGAPAANQGDNNQNRNVRMFNLGPFRLGFAQGGVGDLQEMAHRMGLPADVANPPPAPAPVVPVPAVNADNNAVPGNLDTIRTQLSDISIRIQHEMNNLNAAAHEVHILNAMVNEIARVRQQRQGIQQGPPVTAYVPQFAPPPVLHQPQLAPDLVHNILQGLGDRQAVQQPRQQQTQPPAHPSPPPPAQPQAQPPALSPIQPAQPQASVSVQAESSSSTTQTQPQSSALRATYIRAVNGARFQEAGRIPAGSPELPEGVVLPDGWALLPLTYAGPNVVGLTPPGEPSQNMRRTPPTDNTPTLSQLDEASEAAQAEIFSRTQDSSSPTAASEAPSVPNWGGPNQLFARQARSSSAAEQGESSSSRETGSSEQAAQNGSANSGAMPASVQDADWATESESDG